MLRTYSLGPAITLAIGAILAAACGSPSAVNSLNSGPARATVTGLVTSSAGSPIVGTTIQIACASGGNPTAVSTDSTGHYLTDLQSGSDPFDGDFGQLRCHFMEPAAAPSRCNWTPHWALCEARSSWPCSSWISRSHKRLASLRPNHRCCRSGVRWAAPLNRI